MNVLTQLDRKASEARGAVMVKELLLSKELFSEDYKDLSNFLNSLFTK